MLINCLKAYCFSLEEIKSIFASEGQMDETLFAELYKKKKEIAVKVQKFEDTLHQIDSDMLNLRKGKSIMSYLEPDSAVEEWLGNLGLQCAGFCKVLHTDLFWV